MKLVTNDLHIDNIIATWLAANTYTGTREGKSISATGLIKSTQQQVLGYRAQNDETIVQTIDISTLLKSRIGTALHENIQQCWENPNIRIPALKALGVPDPWIAKVDVNPSIPQEGHINLWFEQRAEKEFRGWTITGQFDLVVGDSLHDFKSTSTYTYINKTKERDYILQGSIYRWLNPDLIKDDFLTIHYIFTDWNKNFVHSREGYPPHPFVLIKLPLMGLQETESWITNVLMSLEANLDKEDLPPCDEHTLMQEEVWQYFSNPDSVKAYKNFENKADAYRYLADKKKGIVKKKPTEPKGCSYCSCRGICKQYDNFVKQGLIK